MILKNAVPWGRSLSEYRAMFNLTDADLTKRILGCSDGPAAFNADCSAQGGDVVSLDPVYHFSEQEIRDRIAEVYPEVVGQVEQNRDDFIWETIASVEELGEIRMCAMNRFLEDYESGKDEGRYVAGSLPEIPFEPNSFELALCSHFLFLYSEQFDYDFHEQSLLELCAVAGEVRIYPLVDLKNERSPYVDRFIERAEQFGIHAELHEVPYRFQKNAMEMLVLKRM